MEILSQKKVYPFLQGGGEMGTRTREFDWSQTSLGTFENWPQSLCTALGILLHSAFPMFLFWGTELICFYNDAYRPSLGNDGKHPALGKRGKDVWTEIWAFIGPLIEQVLTTGEAAWYEDQLVPIFRNGRLEDVYWTFSYSPVYSDAGDINGVLVTCTETTKKVETLRKLQLSEQRFQNLIREATVGIIVLHGKEMIVDVVNETYGRLIGRTSAELLGNPLFRIIPEAEEPFRPMLEKVLLIGDALYLYDHSYFVYVGDQKKEGYLNIVYQPYKEQDGSISGVMALCQDVTEQVATRKKIEESEQRLGLAIEVGELGVFTIDLRNNKAIYSERVIDWFGLADQELPLSAIFSKIHPEDQPFVTETIERSIATEWEGRHDLTYRIISPKNNNLVYLRSIGQVQFENKEPVSISGIIQDITPQVIANKERLAAVFNNAQTAMFTFAPVRNNTGDVVDFRFVITNPTFAAYVRQTPEILNGALGSTWFPGYLTNGVFDMYKQTYLTGETQRKEVHYHVDQHDLYLDLMSTKLHDEVLVTFTDHTALKRAQFQLERYIEDLKCSNQNLEEFAYAASHDLKEPIRKIHFFTDRIKQRLHNKLNEEEFRLFERMESASKRMSSLIDDLLSYSQVSLRPRTFDEVDMNHVIDLVLGDLDLEIEEKGATVTVEKLFTYKGHQRQLQQAFQNLIGNALKYSATELKPHIHISCNKAPAKELGIYTAQDGPLKMYYVVSVQDNGIGFEQKDAERIFNVFTRLHGNAEFRGTGVGLSIVRKVVENHDGFVTAAGEPGNGAIFKVYLPVETEPVSLS